MGSLLSFINKASFRLKIIGIVLAVSLIGIILTVTISYYSSKASLLSLANDQLFSIASISKARATGFISDTKTFTALLGKDRLSEGLMLAYEGAFYSVGKSVGKDEKLTGNSYDRLKEVYKEKINEQIGSYKLERYLLVSTQGQVILSSDFDAQGVLAGRSLTSGQMKDTELATCANKALKSTTDEVFHSKTEYNPIANETHRVYCVRLTAEFDHVSDGIKKGDSMGAVVVELDDRNLTRLLSDRSGMGETGQVYVMGVDGRLRSDMFINSEKFNSLNSYKNNLLIKNEIIDDVNNKKTSGNRVMQNPNGKEVVASYITMEIDGDPWIVVAEKETAEVLQPINAFLKNMILIALGIIVVLVIAGIYLSIILTKPIVDSIETLRNICENLSQDSIDLTNTADVLSESAQSQANDLQSTVQAIDEISATIDQNTANAKNSAQVSESSLIVVETGKQVVGKMIDSMSAINKSNESLLLGVKNGNTKLEEIIKLILEIESKTKVINDIVFQTKLLSFNASVESARAGEHGKGFSVVAEEVGSLASVSGDSAKSISELLQQSIDRVQVIIKETQNEIAGISAEASRKVKIGQETADECGQVFEKILGDVSNVSRMVEDISVASVEQNTGMGEISKAMNRLNSGTEKSTEIANQSLDSAKKLNSRSETLRELVDVLHTSIHGLS